MDEIINRLLDIEFFSQLDQENMAAVAELVQEVHFDEDDVLVYQGQVVDKFYVLHSGEAFVWHMNADGVDQMIRQFEPGDWFGISALFFDDASDVGLRIAGGSTVFVLDRLDFERLLDESPEMWDLLQIPEALLQRIKAPQFDWMTDDETTVF
jgi:CRP-like cAMP-binding protein